MKVIENKYIDKAFPRVETCGNCGSKLELVRADCKSWWDGALLANVYEFVCPCCGELSCFSLID